MPVFLSAKNPSVGRHGLDRGKGVLRLGIVNNMPDAALSRSERQFIDILDAASPDLPISLHLFTVPDIVRSELGCSHLARQGYRSTVELSAAGLDALIVTGTEPKQPSLRDEPFWPALAVLFDWIERAGPSTAFSCLAAHAAVLHFDGIERKRLPQKRCGLFDHTVVGKHALVGSLPATVRIAHSRWNEVDRKALEHHGYEVLTEARDAGVDLFVKQQRNLLLFFQGHPEYDSGTLFREYRRDAQRFLTGEREVYPEAPRNYFDSVAIDRLDGFRARAVAERSSALAEEFPLAVYATNDNEPVSPMTGVFRAWLSGIAAAKTASFDLEASARRVAGGR
jgi:homoserine O-succinyltransferase